MFIIYLLLISGVLVGSIYISLNKKEKFPPKEIVDKSIEATENNTNITKKILLVYSIIIVLFFVNVGLSIILLLFSIIYVYKLFTKKLSYEDRNKLRYKITKTTESIMYNGSRIAYVTKKVSKKDTRSYTEYKSDYFKEKEPLDLFPNYKNIDKSFTKKAIKKSYKEVFETEAPNKIDSIDKDISILNNLVNNFLDDKTLKEVSKLETSTYFGVDTDNQDTASKILNKLKSQQEGIIKLHGKIISYINNEENNMSQDIRDNLSKITTKYNNKLSNVKEVQAKLLTICKGGDDNDK